MENIESKIKTLTSRIEKLDKTVQEINNTDNKRTADLNAELNKFGTELRIKEEVHLNLTRNEFVKRLKEVGMENLKLVYSIIKVISLTTATIVLLNILLTANIFIEIDFWNYIDYETVVSLLLWSVTFMLLLLTYDAAIFGNIYFYKLPAAWVTKFTFSFAVLEFLLFAILKPNFFIEKEHVIPENLLGIISPTTIWFFIHGIYSILISFFCDKCGKMLTDTKSKLYGDDLKKSWETHITHMLVETKESGRAGIISLIVFIVSATLSILAYNNFLDSNKLFSIANGILKIIAGSILLREISKSYRKQYTKRTKILFELNELN